MAKKIVNYLQNHSELRQMIKAYKGELIIPKDRAHLLSLSLGADAQAETFDVEYDVEGKGIMREASVIKCKNGVVVNFDETYMRRRDPDSMLIGDDLPSDKARYVDVFKKDFDFLRNDTLKWLFSQPSLIAMPFYSGNFSHNLGYESLLILPTNAAFFALTLSDIQGMIKAKEIPHSFSPKAIVFVAPPFRHTHFDGKQRVVHNRTNDVHEVFSYNLYPGPSAKKGIYGVLLNIGEREGWLTLHASTVTCTTPYEMTLTIMHEGASGGGKSEMLEQFHRQPNGNILLGVNTVTKEDYQIYISDSCMLSPITDDMALAHPLLKRGNKLAVVDAEDGWFLRVNHITDYGTAPEIERQTIHAKQPLVFFNMDAKPGATCLIWEPIMDEAKKPCPNPRVIIPRKHIDNHFDDVAEIDVRSFGLRAPVCTSSKPSYGIAGIVHVLPPALAWLWRLVSPRGDSNPSIVSSGGLESEGVGSYWPFALGEYVSHANILLEQIVSTPSTRNVLIPNSHIGAYKVGFSGQWVAREYLSRRGGIRFKPDALTPARCPLLGYALQRMKIDGVDVFKGFLQVNLQPEVGKGGYDKGAKILTNFFKSELTKYLSPNLSSLGRQIIQACMDNATLENYESLIVRH